MRKKYIHTNICKIIVLIIIYFVFIKGVRYYVLNNRFIINYNIYKAWEHGNIVYVIIVVILDGITNTDKNNITIQRVWLRANY